MGIASDDNDSPSPVRACADVVPSQSPQRCGTSPGGMWGNYSVEGGIPMVIAVEGGSLGGGPRLSGGGTPP
jgi:hypothetical protein